MDWADQLAQEIVDEPGIFQVWQSSGYCRKCRMPIAGALIDLTKLKQRIAEELRKVQQ